MLQPFDPATYPLTPERPITDHYHGEDVVDPYRWLEAGDSPEVQAWMKAQNAITRRTLDAVPSRESWRARLLALVSAARQEPPVHRGGRYFFKRQDGTLPQAVLMVQEGLDGVPRALIDPNPLSHDATVSLDWWEPSPAGAVVAFGLSEGGDEQSVLHLVDASSGVRLPDTIPGCRYASVAWTSDEQAFYYTCFPAGGADGTDKQRVFFHRLGEDPARDAEIFVPEGGAEMIMWVQLSPNDRWLLVSVNKGSSSTNELHLTDREAPEPLFFPLAVGFDAYYSGDLQNERLYVRTDHQAPRGRVLEVTLERPDRAQWRELIPEDVDALQNAFVAGHQLVTEYLHDAATRLRLFGLDGRPAGELPLPGLGTVSGVSGHAGEDELFFSYTSYLEPATVYRYDLAKGHSRVFFRPEVEIDAAAYEERQVWFQSKDGTRVPMFLVHRKGLRYDGQNPTLLTAYGGFDISLTPAFTAKDFAWIERGGVLAVPNLRGGGEYGTGWHEGGMREKKQNVFDDFLAAAEWLIREGVAGPTTLGIEGGSNGGLLMGAALTQRPELFQAVVCAVPLLDMLRYHQFLIARYWIPEYGSSEDPDGYRTLKAYSPYHRVVPGRHYPATLIVTGESDTRVDPLHARKMAALLQKAQGGPAPIFLYIETKAGHGAGKPLTKRVETSADTLSFLTSQLGL